MGLTGGYFEFSAAHAQKEIPIIPDYPDARPFHEALVNANPEQVMWGTDWPHPRLEKDMPDDGHLLDLFNAWTPDTALRRKILVENPARLYGFE